jgi:DNA-binding transcriptional LysR family regulator
VKIRGNLTTNDGEIAVKWALEGHGILMRAEWDVRPYLQDGRLVQVLPGWHTPNADIYAVYSQRHQMSNRIWAFVDFIAAQLADKPADTSQSTPAAVRRTVRHHKPRG